MSDQITGYSVAGVIEADPNNEFVWVKFVACQAAVAAARIEWEMTNGPAFDFARGQSVGFAAGVKAAREAVAAQTQLWHGFTEQYTVSTKDALAAIDALLKEKS